MVAEPRLGTEGCVFACFALHWLHIQWPLLVNCLIHGHLECAFLILAYTVSNNSPNYHLHTHTPHTPTLPHLNLLPPHHHVISPLSHRASIGMPPIDCRTTSSRCSSSSSTA